MDYIFGGLKTSAIPQMQFAIFLLINIGSKYSNLNLSGFSSYFGKATHGTWILPWRDSIPGPDDDGARNLPESYQTACINFYSAIQSSWLYRQTSNTKTKMFVPVHVFVLFQVCSKHWHHPAFVDPSRLRVSSPVYNFFQCIFHYCMWPSVSFQGFTISNTPHPHPLPPPSSITIEK